MLRLFLLCAFVTAGLTLTAQEATAATATHCQAKKAACQAKTTSVAAMTTPAPERASAAEQRTTVVKPVLFQLTSLETPKPTSCQPADCNKVCDPSQCQPANCAPAKSTSTAAVPAAKTTTLALKQE